MAALKKIKCNICLDDTIENPVFTPCIHGFCSECISRWLDEKKDDLYIPCPICKHDIADLAGARNPNNLFDNTQVNRLNRPNPFDVIITDPMFSGPASPRLQRESLANHLTTVMRQLGVDTGNIQASNTLPIVVFGNNGSNSSQQALNILRNMGIEEKNIQPDQQDDMKELVQLIEHRRIMQRSQPHTPFPPFNQLQSAASRLSGILQRANARLNLLDLDNSARSEHLVPPPSLPNPGSGATNGEANSMNF